MMAIEDFVIDQGAGENLQHVISGVLVKSPIEAVKELVSNSYDADARTVKIEIDEKNQTILVEDDGSGINEKGLDDFMRMGDSNKIANPISPGGRKRIGKFGIAKVLLEFLGDEYKLDTWCNGEYISGVERFESNKTDGLEYTIEKSNGRKTGASILIRKARSVGTKQFSTGSLRNALTWEVPNQKDFAIFLNGEKLVRKNNKPKQRFSFKGTLPEAGKVDMEVHYFTSPPRISGVFVYVNKRVVGGSKNIDLCKVGRTLVNKLFVSVNADGLQKHIAFNRAYIKEDNLAYFEVKKWIYKNLREIKSAIVSSEVTPRKTTAMLPIKVRMQKALRDFTPFKQSEKTERVKERDTDGLKEYYLSQAGKRRTSLEQETSSESRKNKEDLGFSRTQIIDKGVSGPQARINPRTQELLINTGHPWYNSIETANLEVLKAHMILGTAFALGWEKYLQNGGSQCEMNEFYSLCARLLSTEKYVDGIKDKVRKSGIFVPFRRYDLGDITREYMSLTCLRELIDAGVLEIHNNTILGSELNDYMKKALNCTPAVDVVKLHESTRVNRQTGEVISKERIRQEYSTINEILIRYKDRIPFIFDIGKTKSFFLVQNEAIPKFLGLYAQGALKRGVNWQDHMDKYGKLFDKLCKEDGEGNEFVGLEMLCEISRSSPQEVFRIVSYAQKKGIELPFKKEDGVIKYSASHFRGAREQFLIGGKNV